MSKFNYTEFRDALIRAHQSPDYATNRAAVEAVFKPLFDLPPAEQEAIGYLLQKKRSSFERLEKLVEMRGLEHAQVAIELSSYTNPTDPSEFSRMQLLVPIRQNIGKLLGAKASPLTKAFNAAAAKLTPEEIESRAVYTKPMQAVVKAIADRQEDVCRKSSPKPRKYYHE